MNCQKKLDNFVKKAKAIWGDKFNYSHTTFIDATISVNIECPQHGQFKQLPLHHLKGINGCLGCSHIGKSRKTTKEFIESAQALWGSRWDYSQCHYIGCDDHVSIICKEHNIAFTQTPKSHLSKRVGCKLCTKKNIIARTRTNEQFIIDAKAIWGDRWDYSQCQYVNCRDFVTIICKEHGAFQQIADRHLIGKYDCQKCRIIAEKARKKFNTFNNINSHKEIRNVI